MLTVTKLAETKIAELLAKHSDPTLCLRLSAKGGGCSGLQYDMVLDIQRDTDEVITLSSCKVLVDIISYKYLDGTEIGYEETLQGSGFTFANPQATRSCGCGKSFAI